MTSTTLMTVTEMSVLAKAIAESKCFGIETPAQALTLMAIAQAEGLHPAIAARDYHIIQGKPSLKSEAMLARFQRAGGMIEWLIRNDNECKAKFTHPQGSSIEISWTIEMAKAKGFLSKTNWKTYPRQMLSARVVSEGIRAIYPAALGCMYTPEEVRDFVDDPQPSGNIIEAVPIKEDPRKEKMLEVVEICKKHLISKDKILAAANDILERDMKNSNELTIEDLDKMIEYFNKLDEETKQLTGEQQ